MITLVFCNPAEAYKGMTEEQAAAEYKTMAVEDYDKFVEFLGWYDKFKLKRDVVVPKVAKKQEMDLLLTGFLMQGVKSFGPNVSGPFISSSYLFNPVNPQSRELILPDLDIVSIEGEGEYLGKAVSALTAFYNLYGWKTRAIPETNFPTISVTPSRESRLKGYVVIHDPIELRKTAHELVGYNSERLCWREK